MYVLAAKAAALWYSGRDAMMQMRGVDGFVWLRILGIRSGMLVV